LTPDKRDDEGPQVVLIAVNTRLCSESWHAIGGQQRSRVGWVFHPENVSRFQTPENIKDPWAPRKITLVALVIEHDGNF
jgi:hypothetical protein